MADVDGNQVVVSSDVTDIDVNDVDHVDLCNEAIDSSLSQLMDIDSVTECKIESSKADVIKLANEQQADQTLKSCFSLLKRAKGGYYLKNGLLYRVEPVFGQMTEMLVVPNERRKSVLHLAHNLSHQVKHEIVFEAQV